MLFKALGDSVSYEICSGFGCTTYTATLADLVVDGEDVIVHIGLVRSSNNAIDDQNVYIDVNGTEVHHSMEAFFSGAGRTMKQRVPASPGDQIRVRFESQGNFGDVKNASVSGAVPTGDGGGNGDGGGDQSGGNRMLAAKIAGGLLLAGLAFGRIEDEGV